MGRAAVLQTAGGRFESCSVDDVLIARDGLGDRGVEAARRAVTSAETGSNPSVHPTHGPGHRRDQAAVNRSPCGCASSSLAPCTSMPSWSNWTGCWPSKPGGAGSTPAGGTRGVVLAGGGRRSVKPHVRGSIPRCASRPVAQRTERSPPKRRRYCRFESCRAGQVCPLKECGAGDGSTARYRCFRGLKR
jgi:hypothetical protein